MALFDGKFDLGDKTQEISIAPFGGNMAYKKTAFNQYGLFRKDLGRSGEGLMSNEETEFCKRLLEAGEKVVYASQAKVYHLLDSVHEKKSYHLTRTFNHGKSNARMRHVSDRMTRYLRFLIRRIFKLLVSMAGWLFTIDIRIRFCYKLRVYRSLGEIFESFNIIRDSSM
jgi:GT2 family glycosyltransferase